jgi:SAM-dependent methyltransferase
VVEPAAPPDPLRPELFRREDESPDESFYAYPRMVTHIDDAACAAVRDLYGQVLPQGGHVLDLMSSWVSHLPEDVAYASVIGVGLNHAELEANPRLTDHLVHNLNREPALPFEDAVFDGAICTVSIQYLTRPVEVFSEVGRVVKPGAPFVVTFSNRMFPTKAVAVWQALDDRGHANLVALYFQLSGRFEPAQAIDCTPPARGYTDPLYAVLARRLPTGPPEAPLD